MKSSSENGNVATTEETEQGLIRGNVGPAHVPKPLTIDMIFGHLQNTAGNCKKASVREQYEYFTKTLKDIIESGVLPPSTISIPKRLANYNRYRDTTDEQAMEQNRAGGYAFDEELKLAVKTKADGNW